VNEWEDVGTLRGRALGALWLDLRFLTSPAVWFCFAPRSAPSPECSPLPALLPPPLAGSACVQLLVSLLHPCTPWRRSPRWQVFLAPQSPHAPQSPAAWEALRGSSQQLLQHRRLRKAMRLQLLPPLPPRWPPLLLLPLLPVCLCQR